MSEFKRLYQLLFEEGIGFSYAKGGLGGEYLHILTPERGLFTVKKAYFNFENDLVVTRWIDDKKEEKSFSDALDCFGYITGETLIESDTNGAFLEVDSDGAIHLMNVGTVTINGEEIKEDKKKVYLASPLFSLAERTFNESLASDLRNKFPEVDFFVPQEAGEINDKSQYADSKMIAITDTKEVVSSDLVIAVLDGTTIDSGVSAEIGVAFANKIPVIGLYTDSRQEGADNQEKLDALQEVAESQFSYVNLYTVGLIKLNGEVVTSVEDLIKALMERLGEADEQEM